MLAGFAVAGRKAVVLWQRDAAPRADALMGSFGAGDANGTCSYGGSGLAIYDDGIDF